MRFLYLLPILFLVTSCSFFVKNETVINVARVNEHYLTQEDVEKAMIENVFTDSTSFIQNHINNWSTSQLLLDGAMRNVPKEEQDKFESLVSIYKRDLYTKYYLDILINKQLDSVVSLFEASEFYESNKSSFKLNEILVQFKFIQVAEDYDISELEKYFMSDEKEDMEAVDSLKFQYKNHFFNDSIWIKKSAVMQQVNVINKDNATRVLKKSNFVQLRDSLGLYLIAVKNILERNDMAPLEYVRPTINQIIINKRKLALIKKLEKDIKDDAIKNKQFEVYN